MKDVVMKDVIIRSTGSYTPDDRLTNAWFIEHLDTTNEWIVKRTGIKERRRAVPGETTSDMGYQAVKRCLEKANVKPSEIGLLICATVTGDTNFPATGKWIQAKFKFKHFDCWSWDLKSGCTSFLDALAPAAAMLQTGMVKYAVVVAAEMMTSLANYQDRATCILFGDAAACVLLEAVDPSENPFGYGIKNFHFDSDPTKTDLLIQLAGGSKEPITQANIASGRQYLHMDGNRVYRAAVNSMVASAKKISEQAGLRVTDFDWWVFHQANQRISEEVARRLRLPFDRVFNNIAEFGNTSGATLPLCLDQMATQGLLHPGQQIGFISFGTGFSGAGCRISIGHLPETAKK
ncbi:MAG: beta-ketoacyl-ACP synthase 3 [Patescibacteria group bacterium]